MDELSVIYLFKFHNTLMYKCTTYSCMLNNEEIVPFPHYLVVNQYNVDRFECIRKMMVYVLMEFYLWII